jgi:hypothetical protein
MDAGDNPNNAAIDALGAISLEKAEPPEAAIQSAGSQCHAERSF